MPGKTRINLTARLLKKQHRDKIKRAERDVNFVVPNL